MRSFYRHSFDGELPREYVRALKRKHRDEWRDVKPITEDERDAVLAAAADTPQRGTAAKRQALVWTLWDSGFRISELLALRVGSLEPDDEGGAALRLPRDWADLKTGPRRIYVVESIGPIVTWLRFHHTHTTMKRRSSRARTTRDKRRGRATYPTFLPT